MSARRLLFSVMILGIAFIFADHLLSPPLKASAGPDPNACAPCGAPCPSTR